VTSDLIEDTASEGCILCLLLVDCLISEDMKAMREHWQRSKEDPHYPPFLVQHDLYVDGEQPPFLCMKYELPNLELTPREREVEAMVQLFAEPGEVLWRLILINIWG
jgi:hypothetical protein